MFLADRLHFFGISAMAIVFEAMPFLMIGALISSCVEVFVSRDRLQRLVPENAFGRALCGLFMGMILPTCECAIVPIVRRLMKKGVPSQVAICYLLCAPVINPIVIVSTSVAFRASFSLVVARIVVVALCAVLVSLFFRDQELLSDKEPGIDHGCSCHSCNEYERDCIETKEHNHTSCSHMEHEHDHSCCSHEEHACCNHDDHNHESETHTGYDHGCGSDVDHDNEACCDAGHDHTKGGSLSKLNSVINHAVEDFVCTGRFLIAGSFFAGFVKAFFPKGILLLLSENVFVSVACMMLLAFLLSVCSEADAFVANSFSRFPQAARLAFVTFGPQVDLKLIFMFQSVFRKKVIIKLVLLSVAFNYILCLLYHLLGGAM